MAGRSKALCEGKRYCCARNYSTNDRSTVVVLQIHIFHKTGVVKLFYVCDAIRVA